MLNRNEELEIFFNLKIPMLRVHVFQNYHCSCGNSSCASPGKHPVEMHGVKSAAPMSSFGDKYNPAVACGKGFVVLDIDPRNGGDKALAALEAKHGPLPKTWTVTTGGGGTHFYFKVNGEQRGGKKIKGVDLIGMGGYVLAPSAVHPSGRTYEWEVQPQEVDMAPLPSWVIEECVSTPTERPEPQFDNSESVYTAEDVLDALMTLASDCPRDAWIGVGMALKAGGYSFDMFDEWSSKGGEKYKGRLATLATWNSFKREGGITIGTLFWYAERAGWTPRVERWDFSEPPEPPPVPREDGLPPLPPGKLGRLAQIFLDSALHKHHNFAIASALISASALVQGNYCSPVHGGRLGLYYLLTAGASAGKEFYGSKPLDIVRMVDQQRTMGVPMSSQAIRAELNSCNAKMMYLDEGLRWLSMKVESRQPNDRMVIDDLLQIWGGSRRILEGYSTKRDADKTPPVVNPLLCISACGTTEKLISLMRKNLEFIEDGLMSRFDYIISDYVGECDFLATRTFQVPEDIVDTFRALAAGFEEELVVKPDGKESGSVVKTVHYSSSVPVVWGSNEVARKWADLAAKWNGKARCGDALTASIWNRAAEKVVRLASILAAVENPAAPVITDSILEWSIAWQRHLATKIVAMVEDRAGESKDAELQKLILEGLIRRGGQASIRLLAKHDRKIKNASRREVLDAIEMLEMAGEVKVFKGKNAGNKFVVLKLAEPV